MELFQNTITNNISHSLKQNCARDNVIFFHELNTIFQELYDDPI
jgi:hypothetical protein